MALAVAPPVTLQRRLFTVAEYARMVTAGILSEDDRIELIDGEVCVMSPIGSLHAAMVDRLNRLLVLRCAQAAIVRVQSSIQLNDYTEPEPELEPAAAKECSLRRCPPGFWNAITRRAAASSVASVASRHQEDH